MGVLALQPHRACIGHYVELARRCGLRALGREATECLRDCKLVYSRASEQDRYCQALQQAAVGSRAAPPCTRAAAHGGEAWASPAASRGRGAAASSLRASTRPGPLPSQCPPPELLGPLPASLCGSGPLLFSSAFESGNLCSAWLSGGGVAEVGSGCDATYELLMQPDTLSLGHAQWFFFAAGLACDLADAGPLRSAVAGTAARSRGSTSHPVSGATVRLRLLNFRGAKSLFSSGLAPAVWDRTRQRWRYDLCRDVEWRQGPLPRPRRDGEAAGQHHALSFTYAFHVGEGAVFFAFCHPYTLSFLRTSLTQLATLPGRGQLIRRRALATSLAGNQVELLEVTEPEEEPKEVAQAACSRETAPASYRRYERQEAGAEVGQARPVVVVIARQHAGECHGSWMVHGFLEFLTDPKDEHALALRRRFCFHVVPMVNPDGVLFGNSRCTLAGADPNRCWCDPPAAQQPEVCALKEHIASLAEGCYMCLDLHQHSKKRGIFFYSCQYDSERPFRGGSGDAAPDDLQLLPLLAAQQCAYVHQPYCRSSMPACKRTTARCELFAGLGVRWVYTIEASAHAAAASGVSSSTRADGEEDGAAGHASCKDGAEEAAEPALLTSEALLAFGKSLGPALHGLHLLDSNEGTAVEARARLKAEVAAVMEEADADSGEGSDACPSDDNLDADERDEVLAQLDTSGPCLSSRGTTPLCHASSGPQRSTRQSLPPRIIGSPVRKPWVACSGGGAHYFLEGDASVRVPHSWSRQRQAQDDLARVLFSRVESSKDTSGGALEALAAYCRERCHEVLSTWEEQHLGLGGPGGLVGQSCTSGTGSPGGPSAPSASSTVSRAMRRDAAAGRPPRPRSACHEAEAAPGTAGGSRSPLPCIGAEVIPPAPRVVELGLGERGQASRQPAAGVRSPVLRQLPPGWQDLWSSAAAQGTGRSPRPPRSADTLGGQTVSDHRCTAWPATRDMKPP